MSTTKKLMIGSLSRTVLSLAQMAVGFLMMPFLVRHLGDHWYGIWTVVGSTVAYMQMMDLGLSQAIILYLSRYIATKEHDKANTVINTSLAIYSGLSVCVLVITAVLATFIDHIVGTDGHEVGMISLVILVLGGSLAIELPFNAFSGIVGAYLRYELLSMTRLLVLIVNTSLTIYFIGRGYGILALAFIALLSCILFNILFYSISKYCFPELQVSRKWFDRAMIPQLTSISAWSFLSNVSYLLKYRLSAIVISIYLGPSAVTHYAVGSRLADYFRDLLFQATNLSAPILTRYHVLDQLDELRAKVRFLTKINAALAFFGAGMIIVVGSFFIGTWMGPRFLDAYPILVILILAMMFDVAMDPSRSALVAMGKNRFVALLELSEAALNVTLSIVLASLYGSTGVALATAIPLLLLKLLLMPIVIGRYIQLPPTHLYRAVLPILIITAIYLGIYGYVAHEYLLSYSYWRIVITGALSVPLYAFIAYALFFDKQEIDLLHKLLPWRRS